MLKPMTNRPALMASRRVGSNNELRNRSQGGYHWRVSLDCLKRYVELGWPVLPIYEVEFGHCACWRGHECRSPGKHPRNPSGVHKATTDLRQIRRWLLKWPDCNWAIVTGGEHSLVVLDVDPRHEGDRTLRRLEVEFRRLPRTFTVRTGGGGWHHYFSMGGINPPIRNSAGRLGSGLDVRGEGGYVIVPPSQSLDGSYRIEVATSPAIIPDWLVELLRSAPRRDPSGRPSQSVTWIGSMHRPPGSLDEAVLEMIRTPEGRRNHTLNGLAYWAGRQIARGRLRESEAVSRLSNAAELSGLDDDEIDRTLLHGLEAGIEEG